MTDVRLVPATPELAAAFVPLLREEDAAEAVALGLEPYEALRSSVANAEESYVLTFDGELACIFGISMPSRTVLAGGGPVLAWLLTTHAVTRHKKTFLRVSRAIVTDFLLRYEALVNVIDARYVGALRWARWLGFEVLPPTPVGPQGMLFCPFIRRR